jgi:antitoxin component YwqK of YwqJK toxin-antitoxin module
MIGFVGAWGGTDGYRPVIVTLEIPADALTTLGRPGVVNPATATYRANKARVISIADLSGGSYAVARRELWPPERQGFWAPPGVVFHTGRTVEDATYSKSNEVYAHGILFFLSPWVAEMHDIMAYHELHGYNKWYLKRQCSHSFVGHENCRLEGWYPSGARLREFHTQGGKFHGLYRSWYPDGKQKREEHYVNGIRNGTFIFWHTNGRKAWECTFVSGKQHGSFFDWHVTGHKKAEGVYVDGKPHGEYKKWHVHGQKREESTYVYGKLQGVQKKWHNNGVLHSETTYADGRMHGPCKVWNPHGLLITDTVYEGGKEVVEAVREEGADA